MYRVPALAHLYVDFHNFHAEGVPFRLVPVAGPDAKLSDAIARILNDEKAALFVGCLADEVVGFAEIYLRESPPDPAVVPRKCAHLQSLMVAAPMRKHGIGARLVQVARDWTRAAGAAEIELDIWEFPAGPLRFYEALGFKTIRRTLVSDYSTPATRL